MRALFVKEREITYKSGEPKEYVTAQHFSKTKLSSANINCEKVRNDGTNLNACTNTG